MKDYTVKPIARPEATYLFTEVHYARRMPPTSFVFGLFEEGVLIGAISFGVPASRHLQLGACPSDPQSVIELNRLCVLDSAPRNTESWFVSRALALLPPLIVVSYADTVEGHKGYVYRACNFHYAGWTDMERRTPRYDYITPGKHSRAAFRSGDGAESTKVRRRPKIKYWTLTGDKRQKAALLKKMKWPKLCWNRYPAPSEHVFFGDFV